MSRVMKVRVYRQPVLEKKHKTEPVAPPPIADERHPLLPFVDPNPTEQQRMAERNRAVRTASILETLELDAELLKVGVQVYFPLAGPYLFNKSNGAGRGNLRDWVIDRADLAKLKELG